MPREYVFIVLGFAFVLFSAGTVFGSLYFWIFSDLSLSGVASIRNLAMVVLFNTTAAILGSVGGFLLGRYWISIKKLVRITKEDQR